MLSLLRSTIKYQVASSWFFESSVITMMPCPINIRYVSSNFLSYSFCSSYLLVCVVGVATLLGFGIFFPIVFGLYFCSFRLVSNYYYYYFFCCSHFLIVFTISHFASSGLHLERIPVVSIIGFSCIFIFQHIALN